MAIGKASDFVVYQDQVRGAIVERLTQASNFFNGAGGGLRMSTISRRGDYYQESFFKNIANLTGRRDTTSVSAATDLALTMDEMVSVKLNRRVGPVTQTYDAFKKVQLASGDEALSFLIGTQVAKAMEVDMLNSSLRCGVAALNNQSSVKHTVAAGGTITTADLVTGLSKMGDQSAAISTWVMHSKVFFDLVQYQLNPTNSGDNIAQTTLQAAGPATLGRQVIVTDSAALVDTTGTFDQYYTLGLRPGGLMVENSEEETIVSETVTGLDNLAVRMQGEYAFNAGVAGFKWDIANGAANPTDAALATGTNWDPAATSFKDYAGVIIQSR